MDTNQTETAETQQPAGENSQPAADQDKPQFVPPASQEALDKIIEQRLARERAKFAGFDDFKAKAAKFDELEEAKKSQAQKDAERIEALEKQVAAFQAAELKAEIAKKHGIAPEVLRGSTEEELEEHAAALAKLVEAAKPGAPKVPAENAGNGAAKPSGDWLGDMWRNR